MNKLYSTSSSSEYVKSEPIDIPKSNPIQIHPPKQVEYENALIPYLKGKVIPRIMYRAHRQGLSIQDVKLVEKDFDLVIRIQFSKIIKTPKSKGNF